MSKAFSISFFPNLAKAADDKLKPIYCRIIYDRKKAEINTNKKVNPKTWDKSIQGMRGNRSLNSFLLDMRKKIDDIHSEMVKENKPISASLLKSKYLGTDEESNMPVGLIEFIEDDIEKRKLLSEEFSPATIQIYETSFLFFKEYLASKNLKHLLLPELEYKHVEAFELYLRSEKNHSINTATKYMKKINVAMNRAVKLRAIERNPFELYTFKSTKTHRSYLTLDEINRIRSLDRLSQKLEQVRDVFMFGIFTGLRYKDVGSIQPKNLIRDDKGRLWMSKVQDKTGELVKFPILNEAQKILDKYPGYWETHGKILPVPSNQKLNDYIKELATLANIDKNVTFHVARHTFPTTIAPLNKIPIELVSKWLGHEKLATTMIYKKVTDDSLSQYAEGLDEKLGSEAPTTTSFFDERIKDFEIHWHRIGRLVLNEEKTWDNYVRWIIGPILWDLERINAAAVSTTIGQIDELEPKTKGLTIQLDVLEMTFAKLSSYLNNLDFTDINNLVETTEVFQDLAGIDLGLDLDSAIGPQIIRPLLNGKIILFDRDFRSAFRQYLSENGMANAKSKVAKRELRNLIKLYRSLLADDTRQLDLFPKAYMSLDLCISKETADWYTEKMLPILENASENWD
jgi:integrase